MTKLIIAGVISAVVSYLLGSCNSSIIVVRLLKHEDVREHGSKNAGLTNTLRCYGKLPALLTLIGDLGKGIVSVLLSILAFGLIVGEGGFDRQTVGYMSGIFAILGHIFPVYYGFRGGKGVLVSCSILLVIADICYNNPVFRGGAVYFKICVRSVDSFGGVLPVPHLSAALFCRKRAV